MIVYWATVTTWGRPRDDTINNHQEASEPNFPHGAGWEPYCGGLDAERVPPRRWTGWRRKVDQNGVVL